MQVQHTTSPIPVSRDGVCVVDGYGIRLFVERGRLVIEDGIGPTRRLARYSRGTAGLRQLVLLGHTGYLSLEALRLLSDIGVGLIHLDKDGRVLLASGGMGVNDPRLRRIQARALGTPHGDAIARWLLNQKLAGQARIARRLGREDVAMVIGACSEALDGATSPAGLMIPEAAAASAYWGAWSDIPITWARVDDPKVVPHWRIFGVRTSPLTSSPRLAIGPGNALLSYLYAIAEAECRLALLAIGLDPGLGVLHADQRGRDSLALDILEAVRPDVDAVVLDMLEHRSFRRADFFETRQGVCRILAPLTHELAATATRWFRQAGPLVEGVARLIAAAPDSTIGRVATPLTQANRAAGRDRIRRRPNDAGWAAPQLPRRSCIACGGRVATGRRYCLTCRPDIDVFQQAGAIELAERRTAGRDPAHGGEAAKIRGDKWRERLKLERGWEQAHGKSDPNEFRQEILPSLVGLEPRRLVEETGLSRAYCARVLKGEVVPHPRHWAALTDLGGRPRLTPAG